MENPGRTQAVLTARRAGLVGCRRCGAVHGAGVHRCRRCGSGLRSRDVTSLQRVWAWWLAGLTAYIPANIYPMLLTSTFGHRQENTIMGGVIDLFEHGSYGVAIIVFTASILIPVAKFLAIAYLALTINHPGTASGLDRQHLFELVEFIGRWSMIDVFVVAILVALVRLDFVATINPGLAAVSFALSVAFTMISAQSFDPKSLWDAYEADDT